VKVCPCGTIVPCYRHHVFAGVKPFASRLDLGLALGDPAVVQDPTGSLKDTGGFKKKDRITHKLEITRHLFSLVPFVPLVADIQLAPMAATSLRSLTALR
jgi:hypothetical protein